MTDVVEGWLTREQIEQILEGMSADDLIEALDQPSDTKKATDAFNAAAKRLGFVNGSRATEHLRVTDFRYLASRMGEVINLESPLSEGTEDSPASADTGA